MARVLGVFHSQPYCTWNVLLSAGLWRRIKKGVLQSAVKQSGFQIPYYDFQNIHDFLFKLRSGESPTYMERKSWITILMHMLWCRHTWTPSMQTYVDPNTNFGIMPGASWRSWSSRSCQKNLKSFKRFVAWKLPVLSFSGHNGKRSHWELLSLGGQHELK